MILHLYKTMRQDEVTVVYQSTHETEVDAIIRSVRDGSIIQRPLDQMSWVVSDATVRANFEDVILHS